jgi:hypothetical protein
MSRVRPTPMVTFRQQAELSMQAPLDVSALIKKANREAEARAELCKPVTLSITELAQKMNAGRRG